MSDEAFKGEINKHDIFLCVRHGCVGKRHPRHPNGYLRNFVFRNKRRKKGSPSSLLPQ